MHEMPNENVIKLIDRRINILKSLVNKIDEQLNELPNFSECPPQLRGDINDAHKALLDLRNFATNDITSDLIPEWVIRLEEAFDNVSPNFDQENLSTLIIELTQYLIPALTEDFINNFNKDYLDIDAIFFKAKLKHHLNELLDEVIELLRKIAESGEVKDEKTIEVLEKLIRSLRISKNRSLVNLNLVMRFLYSMIKNYSIIQLKQIPVLGPLVEALEISLTNLDEKVEIINAEVKDEIETQYGSTSYLPTYSKQQVLLTSGEDSKINTQA